MWGCLILLLLAVACPGVIVLIILAGPIAMVAAVVVLIGYFILRAIFD